MVILNRMGRPFNVLPVGSAELKAKTSFQLIGEMFPSPIIYLFVNSRQVDIKAEVSGT